MPDPLVIPEPLTAQLLRQRQAALARLALAARGLPPGVTANQLAAAVHADLTDGHPATWPAPLDRAPGAVAAAPPGDEEPRCASCSLPFCAGCGHPLDLTRDYGDLGCCAMTAEDLRRQGVTSPPAPPAGHEDEAAVERAARARETEQLAITRDHLDRWQEWDQVGVEAFACDLDAALAAARGPRTPDPVVHAAQPAPEPPAGP